MGMTLTLTTPIPRAARSSVAFDRFTFSLLTQSMEFFVVYNTGEADHFVYPTPPPPDHPTQPSGIDLLHLLNVANFSTPGGSLEQSALQFLVNDGKLPPGTISGTPT